MIRKENKNLHGAKYGDWQPCFKKLWVSLAFARNLEDVPYWQAHFVDPS